MESDTQVEETNTGQRRTPRKEADKDGKGLYQDLDVYGNFVLHQLYSPGCFISLFMGRRNRTEPQNQAFCYYLMHFDLRTS